MRTQSSWKDYFVFSKKERRIVIGLIIFLIGYGSLLIFYHPKTERARVENADEAIAKLSLQNRDSIGLQPNIIAEETSLRSSTETPIRLFYFDPNLLDENGFKQLGLRDKTIHTIINYRNKGGRFYKPEDLQKIYGLTAEEADKLIPYIQIKSEQKQTPLSVQNYNSDKNKPSYKTSNRQIIDINTATPEQWKSLPFIGDVLSNRIVKYRDKIGGFTSIEQVKKTYGLSDSTYQIILPYLRLSSANATSQQPSSKQKININTATADELKNNPFIPADVAEAIIIYRKQHGNYSSVEDIKKIVFINHDLYQQVQPYLTVE